MAETEPVRLFGRIYPQRPERKVTGLALRIVAVDLPSEAEVLVSDVQLQPGNHTTGWVPHHADMGVHAVEGWQWRNGIIHGDADVIVIADTPSASPARWDVRGAGGEIRIGGYHFGRVVGSASVDGSRHTATQGAGIPAHLTARADIDVPVYSEGRALLTCWFRGLATTDPNIDPPDEEVPEP